MTVLHIIIFLLLLFFFFFLATDIPKEPKTIANIAMPTALAFATPAAPTPMDLGTFFSRVPPLIFIIGFIPSLCVSLVNSRSISYYFSSPTPIEVASSSWFEVGSNSTTVPDPVSEATAFFIQFDQPKTNDLDPMDFWGAGAPYVDFHDFWVLGECISHFKAVCNSRRDFVQGFLFCQSTREHFLKLLESVMNNIEHNFVNTVSTERILQWRVTVQDLARVGFAVEFLLDHLQEIARAFFMKKVQPTVDAIDVCIEVLKEVADLEAYHERLLSGVASPSRFGD